MQYAFSQPPNAGQNADEGRQGVKPKRMRHAYTHCDSKALQALGGDHMCVLSWGIKLGQILFQEGYIEPSGLWVLHIGVVGTRKVRHLDLCNGKLWDRPNTKKWG